MRVDRNASKALSNFLEYKRKNLDKHKGKHFDNVQLITYVLIHILQSILINYVSVFKTFIYVLTVVWILMVVQLDMHQYKVSVGQDLQLSSRLVLHFN